jgi:lysophospholipase L1-like esterase
VGGRLGWLLAVVLVGGCVPAGGRVMARPGVRAAVAVGDSITAYGWPAWVTPASGWEMGNAGLAGDTLLEGSPWPSVVGRFGRDVLARQGVRSVVIEAGTNDIWYGAGSGVRGLVPALVGAVRVLVARAHAAGVCVVVATIAPRAGHPGWTAAREAERLAVNASVRQLGGVAVLDLARLLADKKHPDRLAGVFDVGDGVHPSVAGARVIAAAAVRALASASACRG